MVIVDDGGVMVGLECRLMVVKWLGYWSVSIVVSLVLVDRLVM